MGLKQRLVSGDRIAVRDRADFSVDLCGNGVARLDFRMEPGITLGYKQRGSPDPNPISMEGESPSLSIKTGDVFLIGIDVDVKTVGISDNYLELSYKAPKEIKIHHIKS